jgi:O-antigen/teichoic acid export membrane protein
MTAPTTPRASLKANIAANYAGQIYTAAINIVLLPLQVRLLGAEAYGLVGFFAVLSGWLQLLDVGLSPTLARETVSFRAGALSGRSYGQLFRSLELLFLTLGVTVAILVVGLSETISRRWLHPESLAPVTVARAVAMMGLVFALRWQATLSRSVLIGLERQVWVNSVIAIFATLRSAGVLLALRVLGPTPQNFFIYQAVTAALELIVLRVSINGPLPVAASLRIEWSFAAIRRIAPFSLTIAVASTVWICVTQMDKLLLSKFLPLSEYAWFSLAITAATGINLLSGPIGQAVQPRLTYCVAQGNEEGFRAMYSDATQMLAAIALTTSFTLAIGARHFLWAWTGNPVIADGAAPVLRFYALGNGFLAVVAMTYYLQVAQGDLRLHLKGNMVFAAVLLPVITIATVKGGMLGASWAWFASNFAFFIGWSPIVHRRFLKGFHVKWLLFDVGLPGLVGILPALVILMVHWAPLSRIETILILAGIGGAAIGAASLTTRPVRRFLGGFLQSVRNRAGSS